MEWSRKWKTGAYFTVEAVLVLPVALGVILLVIYLWFFQYDRCLMEQDMGILALKGAVMEISDNEERIKLLKGYEDALYLDKYVAWSKGITNISMRKGKICVKGKGSLKFPFQGLNFWGNNNVWETEAEYKNIVLSPISIIRNYQKIMGGE